MRTGHGFAIGVEQLDFAGDGLLGVKLVFAINKLISKCGFT